MGRVAAIRLVGFYAPVLAAFPPIFLRPRRKRLFPAALLGFLWVLPGLLAVQLLNLRFGWWQFHAQGALFRQMPIDLYLGWAVLWGIVPILVFRKTRIEWVVAAFFALDLILMPACFPVLSLGKRWLIGEVAALAIVLVPAQLFARWTLEDLHLSTRAVFQVLAEEVFFFFSSPKQFLRCNPEEDGVRCYQFPRGSGIWNCRVSSCSQFLGCRQFRNSLAAAEVRPSPTIRPSALWSAGSTATSQTLCSYRARW